MYTTLVSCSQLQDLIASGKPLFIFDCSFNLADPLAGQAMFAQEHIAGAIHADLDLHLSAAKYAASGKPAPCTSASGGRHPLPTRATFAQWLGSMGFDNSMQAVVYDRQGANYCGRLWWMLKWAGHEAVAVLDGGLQAWQQAVGAMETGPATQRSASNYALAPELAALITIETVANCLASAGARGSQTLLDARAAPRFRGEVEPLDPVAGHIPGALNRPFTDNLDANGFFKSAEQLRREFVPLLAGVDAPSVVHHCGSGVSAIPNLLAMEIAGLGRTALFAGSWSEWCSDRALPVAQG